MREWYQGTSRVNKRSLLVDKDRKDDIYGYIIVKFKGKEVHREPVYINKEYKKKKLFDY